jgi:hypothetical protein
VVGGKKMQSEHGAVWTYYQPGYVPAEYVPYQRKLTKDRWGNVVSINTWEKQGCPGAVQPELVRVNKGLTFQKMYTDDPCPDGFRSVQDGYCVRDADPDETRVFYTDKAFIPQKQFWNGYGVRPVGPRRISQPTDLRSVDPFTGEYKIYYSPSAWSDQRRYARPIKSTKNQYDDSWGLASHGGYQISPTKDSYLG